MIEKNKTIILTCPICKEEIWRYYTEKITVYEEQYKGNWVQTNRDNHTREISSIGYWCQNCDNLELKLPDGVVQEK